MKTIIIAIILLLPCVLVLNESDTFIPNIIGFIYIAFSLYNLKTFSGKRFIVNLKNEIELLNSKLR